jgi:hypothetical protein
MAIVDKPSDYFNTVLYTGNGSGQSITGVGFSPEFLWLKERTSTSSHRLSDIIRGTNKQLSSNALDAEETISTVVSSYDSDGFTVGADNGSNESGQTYVSWNWKANGSGVSNTSGSITSTVSANTTSGFSIVSYTGNVTAGATVGHGLGSTPAMIIFKERNSSTNWVVYHHKNTSAPETDYLYLNTTGATADYVGYFNNTLPTSSVFSLGNDGGINGSGDTYIAYCFAEKQGYSKFGSYTGNGNADGTFVYTGFKVAMIICKNTGAAEDWIIKDNTRDIDNPVDDVLYPNGNYVEDDGATVDFLSNGFKCRTTAANTNQSGNTFIYMAFAENPFVTSTAIPACAR